MNVSVFKQFLRFGVIGTAVFAFEAGLLVCLTHFLPWPVFYSRLVCFVPAVVLAWWLNRTFTFISIDGIRWWRELLNYVAVNATGALVNLSAFFLALHFIESIKTLPVAALAIGSVSGLFFNFISSRLLVFYR